MLTQLWGMHEGCREVSGGIVRTIKSRPVKALFANGDCCYYSSLGACCREHGIRYEDRLVALIEDGGLAPDGRTFFDWPTDHEEKLLHDGVLFFRDAEGRK